MGCVCEFVNELFILFCFNFVRFMKNFFFNKISVKFFKGEGEFYNLELDEIILVEFFELLLWICFMKVMCNRIFVKVKSFSLVIVVIFFLKFIII